jgi:hypothetical protein
MENNNKQSLIKRILEQKLQGGTSRPIPKGPGGLSSGGRGVKNPDPDEPCSYPCANCGTQPLPPGPGTCEICSVKQCSAVCSLDECTIPTCDNS